MTNIVFYLYWIKSPHHTDPFTEGYIGVSKEVDRRWKAHRRTNRFSDDSEYKIIDEAYTQNEIFKLERKYRPQVDIGWNVAKGGGGGRLVSMSDETKEKLRKINTGVIFSDDRKNAISKACKGKKKRKMSDEHKAKLSLAKRGKKLSPEHKNKIAKSVKKYYAT